MRNVKYENGIWVFKLHGPGCLNSLYQAVVILGPTVAIMVTGMLLISAIFSTAWAKVWQAMALFITAAVSTTAMLVAYGRMTNLMAAGLGARYEVHIDRNTQRVSAHDRRNRATLWESPYDPNELHLGHTRMRSRHGSYLQPVLVYGDVQQDIIKRGIPTPRQTILTIATQIEIKRLMKRLGQGSENVIKQEPSSTPPSNQSAGGGLLIAMAAVFGTILAAMLLGRKRKE